MFFLFALIPLFCLISQPLNDIIVFTNSLLSTTLHPKEIRRLNSASMNLPEIKLRINAYENYQPSSSSLDSKLQFNVQA